jgi:hypothetical protein
VGEMICGHLSHAGPGGRERQVWIIRYFLIQIIKNSLRE